MTWAGARNETEKQMADVLGFRLEPEAVHARFGQLIHELNEPGTDGEGNSYYELAVANALWGQGGYPFQEDFITLLNNRYKAGLLEVDFNQEREAARQRINEWVAEQTRDRIRDMLPEDSITAETQLVLTNAIYFLGGWRHTFDDERTRFREFHLPGGQSVMARTMQQSEGFRIMNDSEEAVKLLELPYRGREMSMLLILPRVNETGGHPGEALARLQESGKLNEANLRRWIGALRYHPNVYVRLPRFEFTSEMSLKDALSRMGMADAFDSRRADFSGIAIAEGLSIHDILHKAFVKVDEEGTEAAAATSLALAAESAPREHVNFHVDRPFLFVIRHHESNELLFMGRVNELVEEEDYEELTEWARRTLEELKSVLQEEP